MPRDYHFHKLGNLASHLTASGFGAKALYDLSQGDYGAAIFDGSMAGLSELFGYILRQDQKSRQRMDREREIEDQKWQQIEEASRQQDEAGQQLDLNLAYLRGKADMAREFGNRAMSRLDNVIKQRRWKKKMIRTPDYHLRDSAKQSRSYSLLELGLINQIEYRTS